MLKDRHFFRPRRADEPRRQLLLNPAGYSVAGTSRNANQDRYLVDAQRRMFLVADGMGGMRGGERAAQMAVDLLPIHPALFGCEVLDRDTVLLDRDTVLLDRDTVLLDRDTVLLDRDTVRELLAQAFLDVNLEIIAAAERDPQLHGMGTTAVLALLQGDRMYIASVGDSRAYLWRSGDLHQYTIDHNMAQTLVTMGAITREAARTHQWRHMLWKHLGSTDLREGPDVVAIRLEPGDRVVLVSDGVTEVLENRDIINVLDSHGASSAAAEGLVRAAVAHGTRDDATSVVINVADAALCC